MQLSLDYMAHQQTYLEDVVNHLETEYEFMQEEMKRGQEKLKRQKREMTSCKKDIEYKKKALKQYEIMFNDFPLTSQKQAFPCKECAQKLGSVFELKQHYQNKHPKKDLNITSDMLVTIVEQDPDAEPEVDVKEEKYELIRDIKASTNEVLRELREESEMM